MESVKNSLKYIADFRGIIESPGYRCFSTFNYENYQSEDRKPFGVLQTLNDEYLAPEITKEYHFSKAETVLIIPTLGALDINGQGFVHLHQIQVLPVKAGDTLSLTNPYKDHWVNFIQIRLSEFLKEETVDFSYDIKNKLNTFYSSDKLKVSTGIFDSKTEETYRLHHPQNGLLALTVNGAFEFENRLMENRDALCIWDFEEVEFESLTYEGIIFLFEFKIA